MTKDDPQSASLPAVLLPTHIVAQLREAKQTLESHSLADRLAELVGAPLTASLKLLPDSVEKSMYSAVEKSLEKALNVAVTTLGQSDATPGKPRLLAHKVLAGISGATGGALGGLTIAAELPVSTILILRSVADIARSEGEDLDSLEARLACLSVFALDAGKITPAAEDADVGYLAVRVAMGKQIREATKYIAEHGVANRAAPPLVQLINTIAKRFGVVVSEKLAAQAIPVIGALGGALVNTYFIDHYQDIARAHFTIRRLEREFGAAAVREAYRKL